MSENGVLMQILQGTIKTPISICGIGLHSGRKVRVDLLPAAPGAGITFLRTDQATSREVRARVANISATNLSTTIGFGDSAVATIEHLMAAFSFLQIDNIRVLVDSSEVPILDGSSEPFITSLKQAGIIRQAFSRKFLVVKKSFRFTEGDKYIEIEPGSGSTFKCDIDYGLGVIGKQSLTANMADKDFNTIFSARTFCHQKDVEYMKEQGLALGGSLDNAVVVNDSEILNEEGLRSKLEFVQHKMLDCIGDLYLLEGTIVGKLSARKPGHALNALFMQAMLKEFDKYFSVVSLPLHNYAPETDRQRDLRVAASM
jgi:UDP-3-O-[3-hydroxymyristoyl] N-acetylglucosamine deacetylase